MKKGQTDTTQRTSRLYDRIGPVGRFDENRMGRGHTNRHTDGHRDYQHESAQLADSLKTPMINILKNLRPFQKYIFKIQREIIFFTFSNTDQTLQKKFRALIIQHYIRKLLSKLILDCGKCPNQKTCIFTSQHFPVWALPEVENQFLKQLSNKALYNYCSKKLLERFDQYLKK